MARDRLSVGDVVGPYHLLAERAWGQGIYRAAIDTRTYENVSLCEVLPKPDTDEARKARQLTELRHPSLISLRAIEQYDDVMFAVLDGVDGAVTSRGAKRAKPTVRCSPLAPSERLMSPPTHRLPRESTKDSQTP